MELKGSVSAESTARYRAGQCVDCGEKPSAGRPRCDGCHQEYMRAQNEGRGV